MHEAARSKVLGRILDGYEEDKAFAKERQQTAQAFALHAEWNDGRSAEGFPWSLFSGYRWADSSDGERLIVLFGARALEIHGHNLGPIVAELREGKLNLVRELSSSRQKLLADANQSNEAIVSAIHAYPDIEAILMEIKGEDDDQGRHARRLQR